MKSNAHFESLFVAHKNTHVWLIYSSELDFKIRRYILSLVYIYIYNSLANSEYCFNHNYDLKKQSQAKKKKQKKTSRCIEPCVHSGAVKYGGREKATRETSSLNQDMGPEWYQSSFSLPNEIHQSVRGCGDCAAWAFPSFEPFHPRHHRASEAPLAAPGAMHMPIRLSGD